MSGLTPKKIIIKKNSLKRFILPENGNASPFIFFNNNIIEENSNINENQSLNIPVLLTQQAIAEHNTSLQSKVICIKNEQDASIALQDNDISEEAGTSSEAAQLLMNAPKDVLSGQKFILLKKPAIHNAPMLIKHEEGFAQAVESKSLYKMANDSHTSYAGRRKAIKTPKLECSMLGKLVHKYEVENNDTVTARLTYRKLPNIVIEPKATTSNPHNFVKNVKSEHVIEPLRSDMFKIIKLPKDEPVMREASPTIDDNIFCKNDPLLIDDAKVKGEADYEDARESTTESKTDYEEMFYVETVNDFDEEAKERGDETQLAEVIVECDVNSFQEEVESDSATKVERKRKKTRSAKYECSHCKMSFPKEKPYRQHLTMHVKDDSWDDKPFSCWECNLLFATQEAWNKHILSSPKHKQRVREIVNGCRFCGKTFDTIGELDTHKAEGHSRKKKARDQKWPTPCALCGEMQVNYVHYWAHMRRAHPGEKYPLRAAYDHVCAECGKEFRCLALLKQHANMHRGVRPCICDTCGKGFFTPLALQMHSATHSEHRPFVCDTCGAAFKFKHNVERHQLVHTGERPYVCGECGRGFTTLFWTQLHVRKVHYNEHIPYKPRVRKHRPRNT